MLIQETVTTRKAGVKARPITVLRLNVYGQRYQRFLPDNFNTETSQVIVGLMSRVPKMES